MILSLNGIIAGKGVAPFVGLLDTYTGATGAYSLRKLRATYTGNCIRVRRSSDNTSQDIGFINNELDTTSLLSFVGANNGFVSIWYDQSGQSKNMIQNTLSIQPQIVSLGSVLLDGGKPVIFFNSQSLSVVTPSFDVSAKSLFFVGKASGISSNNGALISLTDSSIANPQIRLGKDNFAISYWNSDFVLNSNAGMAVRKIYSSFITGNKIHDLYGNNSLLVTATRAGTFNTISEFTLGGLVSTNGYQVGYINECVLYTTDQTSNRTGISNNINTYYTIY